MAKINLFEDKAYDKLEWLEKAVEPFVFPANDIIAVMPEKLELDFTTLKDMVRKSYNLDIEKEALVDLLALREKVDLEQHKNLVYGLYKLEVDPDTTVDFENSQLIGGIRVVKTKNQMSDEEIRELLATEVSNVIHYAHVRAADTITRMNEIMDLIGSKEYRNSKSVRYKRSQIAADMAKIVTEDKWRVRNYELMVKAAHWAVNYIENGNLASLSNFTRLKCMVHKGSPIYSMEETK